jgi:hypothetical protein
MSQRQSPRQVWLAPLLLAVVSVVGLLSALLADDLGDTLSWVALSVPVMVGSGYAVTGKRKSHP